MSEALPLPPRPNPEQYKKLAKDLQRACRPGDAGAVRAWATRWAVAIGRLSGDDGTAAGEWIERSWQANCTGRCTLAGAQFFIARTHGFASWPKFARHLEGLARVDSPVSKFEAAADAIVSGDLGKLKGLLRENPELARARSTREHRSTLLHYVSANGVEDFRQKTPENIVAIAKALLEAGSEVNAASEAYGGHSTALGLTATSWHPENAGVQAALMEILIEHGANVEGPGGTGAVNSCLRNGRGEAAVFLASRGARLDLEGAAGVGRFDVVRSFFREDGALNPTATREQMKDGFAWACEFGRTDVAGFLVEHGMDLHTRLRHHGQTGLHWAAYGGHAATVRLLLDRGAAVNATDAHYQGTPLEWALYEWGMGGARAAKAGYYDVVRMLVRAGAALTADWCQRNRRVFERAQAGPLMAAALRGD